MAKTVRVTGGYLRVSEVSRGHPDQGLPGGEGPVDPDYGVDTGGGGDGIWGGGGHPDIGLPPLGGGGYPSNGLPKPPNGVWPPLTPSNPIVPIPPGTSVPPGTIWPPVFEGRPDNSLPSGGGRPGRPDNTLPGAGGSVDNTLPSAPALPDQGLPPDPGTPDQGLPPVTGPGRPDNSLPSNKFWVVAGIPGVGWRYICVDPSLRPDQGLPPPVAQPK